MPDLDSGHKRVVKSIHFAAALSLAATGMACAVVPICLWNLLVRV
ncbi:MAG: hypothetical protein M0Z50_01395 [Planctomycetia bacterium]|nr:hypothetical protein [Planctomycetia bacterium]